MSTQEFEEKLRDLIKQYAASKQNGLPALGFMSFEGVVRPDNEDLTAIHYYMQIGII